MAWFRQAQGLMGSGKTVEALPDFLCLGVPKAGSTWLHNMLETHPQIFLPKDIKEIHFFDRDLNRDLEWYSKFYKERTDKHLQAGDITPHYLYTDPLKIAKVKSIDKFIIIHRNPVQRCLSHYKFRIRLDNYKGNFDNFLDDYPHAIEWGLYGKYFSKFLKHYDRSQFLVIPFEKAVKDVQGTQEVVSAFLGIDQTLFPADAGKSAVNKSFIPKSPRLYRFDVFFSKWMARANRFKIRNKIKNMAFIQRFLNSKSGEETKLDVSETTLNKLKGLYMDDQALFKKLVGTSKYEMSTGL